MTATALAVSSALAAIAAALLFAIRARDAERAHDDAVRSRDAALREAERLRAIFRAEEREREELRRRARAAEATAREWSDRCARAERELAEADAEIVKLCNDKTDADTLRIRAVNAEQDAERARRDRVRMARYIQNAAALREPECMAAEGLALVHEAREQLDRVAWILLSKIEGAADAEYPVDLRLGACICGWDVSAWLRRADALVDAATGKKRTPQTARNSWIDPETGLVVMRCVDAEALASHDPNL